MNMKNSSKDGKPSASFIVGAVALLFLIIGYQSALFIHKASVARLIANHDHPDTVYVFSGGEGVVVPSASGGGGIAVETMPPSDPRRTVNRSSGHSPKAEAIRRANSPRTYESFRFDPNTVSIDDLMRLGFSQKQAQSIDNYRQKGGRFRRKSDFARSYVVEDSVYRRLEKYIDIPKIDLNKADSATFQTLPGIGKFFAAKMVSYREELRGYSYPEQLMDIWHFDSEKFGGLKDLITLSPPEPYPLWTLPEAELAKHPYIGRRYAHGIIIFRDNSPRSDWTLDNLTKAGILPPDQGSKLSRCRIAPPP